jgi:dihydrofolate reductase
MKGQPGKGMSIFDSGTIVSLLTQHGQIDEYHFVVSPILLGKGRTLLNDMPQSAKLKLWRPRRTRRGTSGFATRPRARRKAAMPHSHPPRRSP